MNTVIATTTRTTAAGTEFTDSVIPADPPAITPTVAIERADCIVVVIAITKALNAEVRPTVTVPAIGTIRTLKRLTLAQIWADIMTSESDDVFTI